MPLSGLGKQKKNFYDDALKGIFPDEGDEKNKLLAGDVIPTSAPAKRAYFARHFMPFLRQQLVHRFIVNTMSGALNLPFDVTDELLSEVIMVSQEDGLQKTAISVLENIKEQLPPAQMAGKGI